MHFARNGRVSFRIVKGVDSHTPIDTLQIDLTAHWATAQCAKCTQRPEAAAYALFDL